jgi:hypothetical protein
VEEKLKKLLTKTLPVQQLTEPSEEEAKIPSYVKQIIEVSARTLNLAEFVVPRFSLVVDQGITPPKPRPQAEVAAAIEPRAEEAAAVDNEPEPELETATEAVAISELVETVSDVSEPIAEPGAEAPVVSKPASAADSAASVSASAPLESETKTIETGAAAVVVATASVKAKPMAGVEIDIALKQLEALKQDLASADTVTASESEIAASTQPKLTPSKHVELPAAAKTASVPAPAATVYLPEKTAQTPEPAPAAASEKSTPPPERPPLSFMQPKAESGEPEGETSTEPSEKAPASKVEVAPARKDDRIGHQDKKIINTKKGGMGTFFKKLFLFILIFLITIALGIAVGIGILTLTGENPFQKAEPTPPPTSVPTPDTVTPIEDNEPAPEASAGVTAEPEVPAVELDLSKIKVLVVNATGVSGLAGQTKTALDKGEFGSVSTGNAKGEYTGTVDLVLMKEKNTALISALEEASSLSLTFDEDIKTEDTAGAYDAVIVLLKK